VSPVRRRQFLLAAGSLLAVPLSAVAQSRQVPRIGYLSLAPLSETPSPERVAFIEGLRELGYTDGKTIRIDYQSGEMNLEMLTDAALSLVERKVDLIVAAGTVAALAAMKATRSIPIVMMFSSEPVVAGLVTNLARPGGNITGVSTIQTQVDQKRLALLKEAAPSISRVAVLWTSVHPSHAEELKAIDRTARTLQVSLRPFDVTEYSGLQAAFKQVTEERLDAILVMWDYRTLSYRSLVADFALKYRLPTSMPSETFVHAGGLMSYAPNVNSIFRRSASYVDRILKGAKAGDLPVEQPTKFELLVNLKTAKALGITIPQSVLAQADEVIR
jgi:putative tryptophan/tyrosine transport system substrate-binding protein